MLPTEGTKSTEFWLTIAVLGIIVGNAAFEWGLDTAQVWTMVFGSSIYGVSRGLAKMNKNKEIPAT